MWEFALWHRELSPVLRDNLDGWDGVVTGRRIPEGGEICIHVADLYMYGRNQHNIVQQLSAN